MAFIRDSCRRLWIFFLVSKGQQSISCSNQAEENPISCSIDKSRHHAYNNLSRVLCFLMHNCQTIKSFMMVLRWWWGFRTLIGRNISYWENLSIDSCRVCNYKTYENILNYFLLKLKCIRTLQSTESCMLIKIKKIGEYSTAVLVHWAKPKTAEFMPTPINVEMTVSKESLRSAAWKWSMCIIRCLVKCHLKLSNRTQRIRTKGGRY